MSSSIEEILNEHARSVYKFRPALSRNADTSEELTQETFYRAVLSVDNYDGSCRISVWLCQTAKQIWYQELRKRSRYSMQELTEDISDSYTTEELAVISSEKRLLYEAINGLNEQMREIVLLRLSGEYTFSAIGEIFGRNENWAGTNFYRAKKK